MNARAPFQPADLAELDLFLGEAAYVVPMDDIANGLNGPRIIGMRHDCDNVIAPAVAMAEWEAERGYRSTYFILHTAPYWQEKETLAAALDAIHNCGHEIGFHLNALSEAIETGEHPYAIVARAVGELRELGYRCPGVVAHGDKACHEHGFVNDELFKESRRPDYGAAERWVGTVFMRPVTREAFGFEYDPNWLPRGMYVSDSGGEWSTPFAALKETWPQSGQLHMLVHPDWWAEAFRLETATA